MKLLLTTSAIALLALPAPLMAQSTMPGMDMPAKTPAKPAKPAPETPAKPATDADPHAGHDMAADPAPEPDQEAAAMPDMDMPAVEGTAPPADGADPHSGHDMSATPSMADMPADGTEIGSAPAPAPPADHAADALFDPADMAAARRGLRTENGAFQGKMILLDLAEYQARKGGDGYRWEGEAWFGGDINRLLIKSEGEGTFGERIENVEVQTLYARAITPFWNAHAGVRHDIVPNPSRTYAVLGVEGIAPYWFHLTGQLFLSDKGDVRARAEGSYDERITQRLIFQPRAEFNFAAQDMPAIGVGSGLSDFEIGARLRYEITKEFAPYIGVEWAKKTGDAARFARLAGEDPDVINLVAGIRFWF